VLPYTSLFGPTVTLRDLLRLAIPFPVRLELLRAKRLPRWIAERPSIARSKATPEVAEGFSQVVAEHSSPLRREVGEYDPRLQRGKERNVARGAELLDGLLLPPNRTFSYHHAVGRPSRWRGFRTGLELHAGRASKGVGGGCCQITNLLYVLALRGGMKITERHRHALDLFPDRDRQVPFGCGATVYYNYADLRFENPLPAPLLLRLRVAEGRLRGALLAAGPLPFRVEVYEVEHRFFRRDGAWFRENRVRRRFLRPDGSVLLDREEAHNLGRVLYEPEEAGCDAPC